LELRPGRPDGRVPRVLVGGREAAIAGVGVGEPTIGGIGEPKTTGQGVVAGDTCHVDVVDHWGNVVSATPSGGWLQSSLAIPELGFCLGTRLQMFWVEEGLPASPMPGKRPRSTLSPSMAFNDGAPTLAFGTPGGDQPDQWSALMFVHHVDHRMNLQEAIECPAFHTEHMPSSFFPRVAKPGLVALEGHFPEETPNLAQRGHRLTVGAPWSGCLPAPMKKHRKDECSVPPPIRTACRVTQSGGKPWNQSEWGILRAGRHFAVRKCGGGADSVGMRSISADRVRP
jgi:gamma-glutamyltranspeptidase / glutathione hydrolase